MRNRPATVKSLPRCNFTADPAAQGGTVPAQRIGSTGNTARRAHANTDARAAFYASAALTMVANDVVGRPINRLN